MITLAVITVGSIFLTIFGLWRVYTASSDDQEFCGFISLLICFLVGVPVTLIFLERLDLYFGVQ